MKRMMAVCMSLFLLLVSGCSESRTYPQISLDPGNGEVKSISLDDAIAKKDDGENFLLIITQTYCGYCMNFFAESDAYTQEAGITLWCVTLDKEEYSEEQNLTLVHDNFGDFSSTHAVAVLHRRRRDAGHPAVQRRGSDPGKLSDMAEGEPHYRGG